MKLLLRSQHYFLLISILLLFNYCSDKKEPLDHLIKYVENRNDFSYQIKDSVVTDKWKTYHIKMYSGKWLTEKEVNITDWWHWVDIVVPKDVKSDKALMFIGGGTRLDNNSFLDSIVGHEMRNIFFPAIFHNIFLKIFILTFPETLIINLVLKLNTK